MGAMTVGREETVPAGSGQRSGGGLSRAPGWSSLGAQWSSNMQGRAGRPGALSSGLDPIGYGCVRVAHAQGG
jgi:hypothetical protein